ncbi:UNVERIFIED_CONTAM: hypothetical protein Sindi_1169200 [Sesamum indicum]
MEGARSRGEDGIGRTRQEKNWGEAGGQWREEDRGQRREEDGCGVGEEEEDGGGGGALAKKTVDKMVILTSYPLWAAGPYNSTHLQGWDELCNCNSDLHWAKLSNPGPHIVKETMD